MGTPLGPKYIPYTYMDPLGMELSCGPQTRQRRREGAPSWMRKDFLDLDS